jgi:Glycosyl transferases group 1
MSATRNLAIQANMLKSSKKIRIAFSYNGLRRHVTERYLSDAFAPECAVHLNLDDFKPNISVLKLLEIAKKRCEALDVFAHVVDMPALPRDLNLAPIPTAALDIDSFGWTSSRVRWSMLFDYVFVWHPSYVNLYRAAGHPNVFALPHAVDANLLSSDIVQRNRLLDLGWVGGFGYGHHVRRKRIIGGLAARFKMNDFRKPYSKEETAEIYRQCRIVVNVSRDDFPAEANMRCYEAMGGGALLITGMPSELIEWGFREGEHFVGWRNEAEIPDLVDYYLQHEEQRSEISRAGRELTLSDFTFQRCRDKINAILQEHPNQFFAPARTWPTEEIHLAYLEHYYRHQLFDATFDEFAALRKASPRSYWRGLPMVLKTLRHCVKSSLM